MPTGIIFWVLMILWLVLGGWGAYGAGPAGWHSFGGTLLEFVLFALLGWRTFGAPVQN